MVQTRQSSGVQPKSLKEPDRDAELRASLIIETEKWSQLEYQLLKDRDLPLKALESSQQLPALREREIVPTILRVSVHESLGVHEVHSTDISRIYCEDPPAPIVSIHLGQETQTDISRDRRPSKQPKEALRPPYQSPIPGRDEPLRWFHSLPEGSIHTFEQLQKIFIKAYAHNKDKEENLHSLITLKQTHGEKLEEFSMKYLELARMVDNLDQKTAVSTFTNALKFNCKAKEYLFLKKPKTLEDMIENVNNYIDLERMMPEPNKPIKAVHNTKDPSIDFNNNRSSSEPGDPRRAKTEPERDNNQRSLKPSRTVIPKLNFKLSEIYPIL
ncbi:hypothetical protein GIB67_039019 [Kingdonia uniflora]|uniref:Retrotransposon gag domain-containing protein n=1 Tax=Kingdonia uniflora TaxID=39325 RepID=A0A7J7LKQ6_9MAGN|nr:hypothetical protein GIB67_039019 [Kingdonia uniflora]